MDFSSSVDNPDCANNDVIPMRNEWLDKNPFTPSMCGFKASLIKLFNFLAVRADPEASLKAGWSGFSTRAAFL